MTSISTTSAERLAGPSSPPLQPDAEQARELLEEELSKSEYIQAGPDIFSVVYDRIRDFLRRLTTPVESLDLGLPPWVLPTVGLLIVAVVVTVLIFWLRPQRLGRRIDKEDQALVDRTISGKEYLQRARHDLAEKRYREALTYAFRAMVRDGQERVILDEHPALTASYAAQALGRAFPDHRKALKDSGELFNAVFYGGVSVGASEAHELCALAEELATSRPAYVENTAFEGELIPR